MMYKLFVFTATLPVGANTASHNKVHMEEMREVLYPVFVVAEADMVVIMVSYVCIVVLQMQPFERCLLHLRILSLGFWSLRSSQACGCVTLNYIASFNPSAQHNLKTLPLTYLQE